ncbi:hypothetical protein PENSPDRAFT_622202 [Peniophora sp. CONT]|nr:hypothetical protein PENSPDRAFT_622202 [Peniophora sp. CONT]
MHRSLHAAKLASEARLRTRHCLRGHSTSAHGLLDELEGRGFVSQTTRPEILRALLEQSSSTVYSGIDPTGVSLHVGHILPMMSLVHFQLRGHKPIALIGGATALIGDPSGRSTERPHLAEERVQENFVRLRASVERFFNHAQDYASSRMSASLRNDRHGVRILNNADWFRQLNVLDFLRLAGTHARVNAMLARESVQSRLNSQQGISFSEFSYQLLQAYDFLWLHQNTGCTVQVGGSDQWGNIVAGIDLINRTAHGGQVTPSTSEAEDAPQKGFGITTPLLTTASGEKFGKSAGNAVWLDRSLTSVLDFYQFFLRTPDADVGRYLKLFTLLPLQTIEEALAEHAKRPEQHAAQKLLADEVTTLVHTENGLRHAHAATRVLFGTDLADVRAVDAIDALEGDPRLHTVQASDAIDAPVARLAQTVGLVKSFGAAKSLIKMGGLYLNGKPVSLEKTLDTADLLDGKLAILRAGKNNHAIVTVQ